MHPCKNLQIVHLLKFVLCYDMFDLTCSSVLIYRLTVNNITLIQNPHETIQSAKVSCLLSTTFCSSFWYFNFTPFHTFDIWCFKHVIPYIMHVGLYVFKTSLVRFVLFQTLNIYGCVLSPLLL